MVNTWQKTQWIGTNYQKEKFFLYLFKCYGIQLHFDIKACNQRIVSSVSMTNKRPFKNSITQNDIE